MKYFSLLPIALLLNTISIAQETDYSLSNVKSFSGKFVFYNLEPFDAYSKAFTFPNKLTDTEGRELAEIMKTSLANATKESGFQEEPFDAILIKDGEERSIAIKFTEKSKNNSLAKIGKVQSGVYIFRGCEPANPYDFIANINLVWHTDPSQQDKALQELIERSRKKYPNFDGLLFKDDDNKTASIIKFRGLEVTGGGFRAGDKALFKSGSKPLYGEIAALDNTKQEASFKYYDDYGDEKLKTLPYAKLSPVPTEQYENSIKTQNIEIEKHKFSIGEKVSWSEGKTARYGEVSSQNPKNHDATVTFLNVYGENKTDNIDFLKLDKLDSDKFQEFRTKELEEIKKHQFDVGQKVSFVKDKKPKCGEIVSLNTQNHKATIKYLGIFAEDKTIEDQYLDIEKISDEKYNTEIAKNKEDALKYKFAVGEKIFWSKGGLLTKSEQISGEIVAIDETEHKATIKYMNKDNVEKQEKVSYLDLSKVQ